MNRLHDKGMSSDSVGKAKSVVLTNAGLAEAARHLHVLFGRE